MKKKMAIFVMTLMSFILIAFSGCKQKKNTADASPEPASASTVNTGSASAVETISTEEGDAKRNTEEGKTGEGINNDDSTEFKPIQVDEDFDINEEIEEGQAGGGQ